MFENNGRSHAGRPAYWEARRTDALSLVRSGLLEGIPFRGRAPGHHSSGEGRSGSKGSPGGALTVSADGKKSGIVWATLTVSRSADHGNAAGVLRAFDAESLQEIWSSEMQPRRDRLGTLVKFNPPTVIAGRVYVPNYDNGLNVYGVMK